MTIKVLESFCQGKAGDARLNEDRIVVTADFVGLFDGATSRRGLTLAGLTIGRFAAETACDALATLPPDATARAAINHLSEAVATRARAAAQSEDKTFDEVWHYPAAAALIYSKSRKEIWRVADSTFVVDGGVPNMRFFAQEKTWCDLRRAWLQAEMVRGKSVEDLLANDMTWDLLSPLIGNLKVFANCDHAMAHPYGYGVINGSHVPDRYVEVFDASEAQEIVFASDGYPEVFASLEETERALKNTLREDPLMMRLHPQVKGVKPGWESYDDRSYVRFKV